MTLTPKGGNKGALKKKSLFKNNRFQKPLLQERFGEASN